MHHPATFLAAAFMIGRTWKQAKCPSTDQWMEVVVHIYMMEHYSPMKKERF